MSETFEWRCAGLSVVGASHVEAGIPCQDHCHIGTATSSGRRVVAISDGAGSAKNSRLGAQIAAQTMAKAIAGHSGSLRLIGGEASSFGTQVRAAITQQSTADQCEFSDYACTLLAAAFENDDAYFWQIGDGAWIYQTTDHHIECATWPYKGEFNNYTTFITSDDWDATWTQKFVANISAVAGFTDGMEMFCLDNATQKPHLPFIQRILLALENRPEENQVQVKIQQMLDSPLIREREDDDLTFVLAWRGSQDVLR